MQPYETDVERLYLVRHGTSEGADGLVVGQIDLELSDAGAADLRALGESWQGPPPDRLISSDLLRASRSADVLSEVWGLEVSARDPRLREIDFGEWDGMTWKDLRRQEGDRFETYMQTWWDESPPGGESMAEVGQRATDWFYDILDHGSGVVVAVAHGGSIRTILAHVLKMPGLQVFNLHLDHGRVSSLGSGPHGLETFLINGDRFPNDPRA